MSRVRAIIMAAGKGTRLKSELPKVLHPLMGKPLLQRVLLALELLQEVDSHSQDLNQPQPGNMTYCLEEACFILGHQADRVKDQLMSWSPQMRKTTVLQTPQLGTGHAVMQVPEQLPDWKEFDGTVFILSGDVPLIRPESLAELLNDHVSAQRDLTILSTRMDNPFGYGRLILDDNGGITAIVEEKDATLEQRSIQCVNTGIYCLNWPTVSILLGQLSNNNAQGEFYLTDLIRLSVQAGLKTGACELADSDEVLGVNSRVDLALSHKVLKQRTASHWMAEGVSIIDPSTTSISPEVTIGRDTVILPGTILEGAIQIGSHCEIGPYTVMSGTVKTGDHVRIIQSSVRDSELGSYVNIGPYAQLRDEVQIADYVNIGNFVEVKQSQLDHHTNASHLAYIGNATLGHDVNIGAGTITANYDPIRDIKSDTHVGDYAKVGSNSVLIAPVTIEENASVAAGSVVTKTVPKNSLAIARGRQTNIDCWVEKVKAEQALAGQS